MVHFDDCPLYVDACPKVFVHNEEEDSFVRVLLENTPYTDPEWITKGEEFNNLTPEEQEEIINGNQLTWTIDDLD